MFVNIYINTHKTGVDAVISIIEYFLQLTRCGYANDKDVGRKTDSGYNTHTHTYVFIRADIFIFH